MSEYTKEHRASGSIKARKTIPDLVHICKAKQRKKSQKFHAVTVSYADGQSTLVLSQHTKNSRTSCHSRRHVRQGSPIVHLRCICKYAVAGSRKNLDKKKRKEFRSTNPDPQRSDLNWQGNHADKANQAYKKDFRETVSTTAAVKTVAMFNRRNWGW